MSAPVNNLTVGDEPCQRIFDAFDESDETARAIILPLLMSEPIVSASPGTKFNIIEHMLMYEEVSEPLKLFCWNSIKDAPAWQEGINFSLSDLVIESAANSPFIIFKELFNKLKAQSDRYKSLLKFGKVDNGCEDGHREFIEQEKQLLDQLEPELDVFNRIS